MDEAHAPRQEQIGKVILIIASCLSAALVIAGLIYATGTGARMEANLLASGCEPGLSSDAQACTTQPMLASQYLAVVTPATQQLNVDVAAYAASEGHSLAAAEAVLAAEVTSIHAFDASLGGIEFPPAITPLVQALIRANQARAELIAEQARSSSLSQLRSFDHRAQVASAAVQAEMNLILKAVDAPVPAG
jgi:hypothetical protein